MVNKAKKQGTTYETNIVNRLNKEVGFKAQDLLKADQKIQVIYNYLLKTKSTFLKLNLDKI